MLRRWWLVILTREWWVGVPKVRLDVASAHVRLKPKGSQNDKVEYALFLGCVK